MKISITKEQHSAFLKALKRAESVTRGKTTLPVLGTLLFTATKGKLEIQANNLDQSIVLTVESEVFLPGQACLNSQDILRIAGISKSLDIEIDKTTATAKGSGTFKLPIIDPGDFPPCIEVTSDLSSETFSREELRAVIECDYASSDPKAGRYVIEGVCINVKAKQGVTTDGQRLALSSFPPSTGDFGPIVPSTACRLLGSLIEGNSFEVKFSERAVSIKGNDFTFYSKLIEGKFPNFRQAIPQSKFGIKVDRKLLLDSVDRATVALSDIGLVRLSLSKSEITLAVTGKNCSSEVSESLNEAAPLSAQGFSIGVNSGLLRDALNAQPDEEVEMKFIDDLSPIVVQGTHYSVIMPLRCK